MVYVPESISSKFEEAASANTRQNIETCAILAGKLVCWAQCNRTTHKHVHVHGVPCIYKPVVC